MKLFFQNIIRAIVFAVAAFPATISSASITEYHGSVDYPINGIAQNYTDEEGVLLQGFLSLPNPAEGGIGGNLPAVVILHDASGLDDYEKQRATMMAQELGYVGFAADIFGASAEIPEGQGRWSFIGQFLDNATLFASRIEAAIEHVKSLPEVDPEKVALAGYCLGGSGIVKYLDVGKSGASAGASFHPSFPEGALGPVANVTVPVLVLTGGDDMLTSPTAMKTFEDNYNEAGATWETIRYSEVDHAFTNWFSGNYNRNADARSWESMSSFFKVHFGQSNYDRTLPVADVTAVNYTDGDVLLRGYLSLPDKDEPSPAVVIVHDANGPDKYEQERATQLAKEHGYVALAADVFGYEVQANPPESMRPLMDMYRQDFELFVTRIQAGIDYVKGLEQVDSSKIAIMGYCFGGTGVLSYALTGTDPDVRAITSFHGGLSRGLPDATSIHLDGSKDLFAPLVMVESGGDDDAMTNIIDLEETMMAISANYEISRYSNVQHAFTNPEDSRGRYNARAAVRSFDAMTSALSTVFAGVPESSNIVDIAVANAEFSTLVSLVQMAGLVDTLNGPGPFTLFAPTDEAFGALPPSTVAWLTAAENKDALVKVLTYHVVSGNVMSSGLIAGDVATVEGQPITVSLAPVMINTANVITADIKASNGVIHVIDSILIPDGVLPDVDANIKELNWILGFGDASARATSVDAGTVLNFSWQGYHDVQVFPTKEAFDACDFTEAVLLGNVSPVSYTVTETTYFSCSVPGHCPGGQKLEAMVSATTAGTAMDMPEVEVKTDEIGWLKGFTDPSARATSVDTGTVLNFSWQGYHDVQVFPTKEAFDACDFTEAVSLGDVSPVSYTVTETTYFACSVPGHCLGGQKLDASVSTMVEAVTITEPELSTVADIAMGDETFSTLVSLVQMAGLVATLTGPGPYTVFAPTNEAFEALPASTVAWLTAAENKDALVKVLMYHVVAGNVMSGDLIAGDVTTAEGQPITVSLDPAMINTANVITADIKASNGVIHVVDSVLIPDGVLSGENTIGEEMVVETPAETDVDSAGCITGTVGNLLLISSALFWSLYTF